MLERARPSRLAALAAAFALALLLPWLGSSDYVGDDEALDAGVVWTIHERGDWLFPEFNDEYLPPKPPLYYWLSAVVGAVRGRVDEWSVRLPSAICAAGTVFLTVAGGARFVGNGGAFLGGLMLSVMPVFRDQARLGRADMTMTILTTAALLLYFTRPAPLSRGARWLFFGLLGLAALAKGAAGVGLVVAVVAVDAWRDRARAASLLDPGILAFVAVGGFWYALGAAHWGERFVVKHVLGENFRHFFGSLVVEERPVRGLLHHLTHFVNVFTGTAPWGFLLPFALRDRPAGGATGDRAKLVRWVVAGFVFFTLATRKSPYYLLPIFPPLALLVGEWAWRRMVVERAPVFDATRHLRPAVGALVIGAVALVSWRALGMPGLDGERAATLAAFADGAPLLWAAIAVALVALGLAVGAAVGGRVGECVVATLAVAALSSEVANAIEPPLARAQSLRKFALEVAKEVAPEEPLYFFEMPLPAIALYGERTIPTVTAGDVRARARFGLIVPESLEPRLPEAWKGGRVLVEQRARVFTRTPMRIRLLEIEVARSQEGF